MKILTYNIYMRPPLIHQGHDDLKQSRNKYIISQILSSFDIICFQEIFSLFNFRKEQLIQAAIQRGIYYWAAPKNPSLFSLRPIDSGLLILSKYPIVQQQFLHFQLGILSDSLAQKGILYAKINNNGKIIHLFTSHTQASYHNTSQQEGLTIAVRLKQFKMVQQFIQQTVNKYKESQNDLVLLCGDLNCDGRKPIEQVNIYYEKQVELKKFLHYEGQQFKEVKTMQYIFSNEDKNQIINHHLQKFGQYPITYLQNQNVFQPQFYKKKGKSNNLLNQGQCLDYFIQFRLGRRKPDLHVRSDSLKIEQFKIHKQNILQLSDHYGLSILIQ